MTAPYLHPPETGTTERRRILRDRDLPGSLDTVVLRLFRGLDTLDIGQTLGVHESLIVRALARARCAERAD